MLRLCQAGDAWRRPRGFYGGECGTIGPLWTIMDHWTFEKCLQMLCVSLWSLKAFGVFTDAPGIASRNDDAQAWVFAAFSALQKRVALVCFKSHWGWWPSLPFSTTSQTFTECSLDAVFCSLVSDYFDPSQPRYLRLQVRQRCGDDKSITDAHWNIGDRHSVEGSLEMPTDASLLHV